MFSHLITVAIALFAGQVAQANPLARARVNGASSLAGSFPVKSIDSVAARPNVTLPGSSVARNLHIEARQEFPATLLTCSDDGCTDCQEFGLSVVPLDICLPANDFFSTAVSQPSNEGLPFEVLVGPPGCESFAQIPTVNECFNLNGGPFSQFALA